MKIIDDGAPDDLPQWMTRRSSPTVTKFVVLIACFVLFYVLLWPNFVGRTSTATVSPAKADLAVLASAVEQFKTDCGRYPTTQEGLAALIEAPPGVKGWCGPYLKALIIDPWGKPFRYRSPGRHGKDSYLVVSYGADGKPGGVGVNADLEDGSD